MSRYLLEQLPRVAATYLVTPLAFSQVKAWLNESVFASAVGTTELISALETGFDLTLSQLDGLITLRPGDQALVISLSFGVLLAYAEGKIPPLPEDWRSFALTVAADEKQPERAIRELALADDLLQGDAI